MKVHECICLGWQSLHGVDHLVDNLAVVHLDWGVVLENRFINISIIVSNIEMFINNKIHSYIDKWLKYM